MARLTEAQVEETRRRVEAGERRDDVAAAVGISRSSVDSIMTGRRGGPSRRAGALDADAKARIVALADAGMSQTAIAREVGTSQQMVSKTLKAAREGQG
ncbi:helix-turn-helix domain-containing protein [Demequina rhizosphaerae]|uniref:helix-turn-helix domain-containing protein n=1 Tax=Demequina rhizosphaerae TaxID=1638985 RepID=UPI000A07D965|nr:helix-turn-helix domain-containing protein [Demequina rhizosphaerae]